MYSEREKILLILESHRNRRGRERGASTELLSESEACYYAVTM